MSECLGLNIVCIIVSECLGFNVVFIIISECVLKVQHCMYHNERVIVWDLTLYVSI